MQQALFANVQYTEHRQTVGEALVKLGEEYPNLFVLTPDVPGSTRANVFEKAFPHRFLNTGVSEQNTVGVASGLSREGFLPVIVGFAMFAACKAWEPLRNSVAYPGLNVKIFATHGGLNVGEDGATAQAIEDIALMRAIPGMVVLAPTDGNQVLAVMRAALRHNGPVYVRMEREAIPQITEPSAQFSVGQSLTLRQGDDAAIFAIGGMVAAALQAAVSLAVAGIQTRVISMVSIKPLDEPTVLKAAREAGPIVVAEDHNRYGGLGSAVAEVLAREALGPMEYIGVQDVFGESGSADDLRVKYHLTPEDIASAVRRSIARYRERKETTP